MRTAVQLEGNWSCPQLSGALAAIWSMPHGSWTICLFQNAAHGEQQQPGLLWHCWHEWEALLLLGWSYQTLCSGKKLKSAKSIVHPQMEVTSGKLRMIQGKKKGLHSLVWGCGTVFFRNAALIPLFHLRPYFSSKQKVTTESWLMNMAKNSLHHCWLIDSGVTSSWERRRL